MANYTFNGPVGIQHSASATVAISLAGIPAGSLVLAHVTTSGTNETVAPTNYTWTQLNKPTTTNATVLLALINAGTETTETFVWSGAGVATVDVSWLTGPVYTDLTSIVVSSWSRESTNQSLVNFSAATLTPTVANCAVICGGRKLRTNSTLGTFGNVSQDGSSFNQISYYPTTAVSYAQAAVWNYWIQTTATNIAPCSQQWSVNDASAQNEQGWIVALQPSVASPPTFTTAPTQTRATSASASFTATSNIAATLYAVAVMAGDAAPSATQIIAGQNNAGGAAFGAANVSASAGTPAPITVSALPAVPGIYDFYFVLNASSLNSSVDSLMGVALVQNVGFIPRPGSPALASPTNPLQFHRIQQGVGNGAQPSLPTLLGIGAFLSESLLYGQMSLALQTINVGYIPRPGPHLSSPFNLNQFVFRYDTSIPSPRTILTTGVLFGTSSIEMSVSQNLGSLGGYLVSQSQIQGLATAQTAGSIFGYLDSHSTLYAELLGSGALQGLFQGNSSASVLGIGGAFQPLLPMTATVDVRLGVGYQPWKARPVGENG